MMICSVFTLLLVQTKEVNYFTAENITAFTTILLALITAFYAYWTYKMVRISKEEFELLNRPYVFVSTMDAIQKEGNNLSYMAMIENKGKTPAFITCDVKGQNNLISSDSFESPSNNLILSPGSSIKRSLFNLINIPNSNISVELTITYKSLSNNNKNYITKYEYQFKSTEQEYRLNIKDINVN